MVQLVCLYHRSNTNTQFRHMCCNCRRTRKKNQFTIVTQHSQLEGKCVWRRARIWQKKSAEPEGEGENYMNISNRTEMWTIFRMITTLSFVMYIGSWRNFSDDKYCAGVYGEWEWAAAPKAAELRKYQREIVTLITVDE